VDQHLNNDQNEFLWTLLANPATDAHSHVYNLQRLVNEFPQSGVLQALLAYASDEKNIKQASVYFNAKSLYKLINNPSAFVAVPNDKIIVQNGIGLNGHDEEQLTSTENLTVLEDENISNGESENYFSIDSTIESIAEESDEAEQHHNGEIYEHHLTETLPEIENEIAANYITAEEPADEQPVAMSEEDTVTLVNDETDKNNHNNIEEEVEEPVHVVEEERMQIEDETFDEIVGIEQINFEHSVSRPDSKKSVEAEIQEEKPDADSETPDESDELIPEHIASSDFFMFDSAFGEHKEMEQVEDNPIVSSTKAFNFNQKHIGLSIDINQDVSKYYDEKMPYSFMWWLDKTRKEHAGLYQPYKTEQRSPHNKTKRTVDELQQQYYENIFHITSLEELDKSTAHQTVEFDMKRKEHQIIDRFIQEDPQIKPQSSDKIDNENKAKTSSEDRDELVTETLAHIYTEQMLYHKAIAAYKKLMLKFPEKSRYFADKVEQIEKKIN
jgi:hypothetical protein